MKKQIQEEKPFDVRDQRDKGWYWTDDEFLNGYAKFVGIYAVGVYHSLCRHADKEQQCWPSIEKMCEELNISRDSVINAIKKLEFCNIIKKERIGKKCTNRYNLLKKINWKPISEVCHNDFTIKSEVDHSDFTSRPQRLHESATATSIVRVPNSKGNTSKDIAANAAKGELEVIPNLLMDKQKHIRIIGLFAAAKNISFVSKDAQVQFLKRNLRSARLLTPYSIDRLREVMEYLELCEDFKWTLESVAKYVDEDLNKLAFKKMNSKSKITFGN